MIKRLLKYFRGNKFTPMQLAFEEACKEPCSTDVYYKEFMKGEGEKLKKIKEILPNYDPDWNPECIDIVTTQIDLREIDKSNLSKK